MSPPPKSTLDEPFRVRFSRQDETRLDYWRRMEFTPEQWHGLAAHVRERGLVFLSSAFSLAAVELLKGIGVAAWKIGSGEFASCELWDAMMATAAPILFSTGLAKRAEIEGCRRPLPVARPSLRASSMYDLLSLAARRGGAECDGRTSAGAYRCPVGLSDHSGSVFPGLAALGARRGLCRSACDLRPPHVRPRHACLAHLRRTADAHAACGTPWRSWMQTPVDKDEMAERLQGLREMFGKSLAPVSPNSRRCGSAPRHADGKRSRAVAFRPKRGQRSPVGGSRGT